MAVALCLAAPAHAQLNFGLKGGVNLSKASLSDIPGNFKKDNFTGFFIGPMAEVGIPFTPLSVDGALLFAQRGVTVGDGQGNKETFRQNGLDIPVNLKLSFGLGSMAGIYLAAGPDFFFDFKKSDAIKKKKAEVGINVGAGVKLLGHLQVGANYNIPLTKTADIIGETGTGSYKTKTWQVSLAYLF